MTSSEITKRMNTEIVDFTKKTLDDLKGLGIELDQNKVTNYVIDANMRLLAQAITQIVAEHLTGSGKII